MKVACLGSLAAVLLAAGASDAQPVNPGWSNARSLQAILDDGAAQQADKRLGGGIAALGVGSVFTAIGIGLMVDSYGKSSTINQESGAGIGMVIGGGLGLVSAPFIFAIHGDIEHLAGKTGPLAAAGNVKEMESMLAANAHRERTFRIASGLTFIGIAAVITPIGVVSTVTNASLDQNSRFNAGAAIGVADAILIGVGVAQLIAPSLAEQIHRAWVAGSWRSSGIRVHPFVSPQNTGFVVRY